MLASIDSLSRHSHTHNTVVGELRTCFNRWAQNARKKLDTVSEEFPEFYHASQQRLAERMMLHSQRDFIVHQRRSGAIPNTVAALLLGELESRKRPGRLRSVSSDGSKRVILCPPSALSNLDALDGRRPAALGVHFDLHGGQPGLSLRDLERPGSLVQEAP